MANRSRTSVVSKELQQRGYAQTEIVDSFLVVKARLLLGVNSSCVVFCRMQKRWVKAKVLSISCHDLCLVKCVGCSDCEMQAIGIFDVHLQPEGWSKFNSNQGVVNFIAQKLEQGELRRSDVISYQPPRKKKKPTPKKAPVWKTMKPVSKKKKKSTKAIQVRQAEEEQRLRANLRTNGTQEDYMRHQIERVHQGRLALEQQSDQEQVLSNQKQFYDDKPTEAAKPKSPSDDKMKEAMQVVQEMYSSGLYSKLRELGAELKLREKPTSKEKKAPTRRLRKRKPKKKRPVYAAGLALDDRSEHKCRKIPDLNHINMATAVISRYMRELESAHVLPQDVIDLVVHFFYDNKYIQTRSLTNELEINNDTFRVLETNELPNNDIFRFHASTCLHCQRTRDLSADGCIEGCVGVLCHPPPRTVSFLFGCSNEECGQPSLIQLSSFEFDYRIKIMRTYYHYRVEVTPFGRRKADEMNAMNQTYPWPEKGACFDCGRATVQMRECRKDSILLSQTRFCRNCRLFHYERRL